MDHVLVRDQRRARGFDRFSRCAGPFLAELARLDLKAVGPFDAPARCLLPERRSEAVAFLRRDYAGWRYPLAPAERFVLERLLEGAALGESIADCLTPLRR